MKTERIIIPDYYFPTSKGLLAKEVSGNRINKSIVELEKSLNNQRDFVNLISDLFLKNETNTEKVKYMCVSLSLETVYYLYSNKPDVSELPEDIRVYYDNYPKAICWFRHNPNMPTRISMEIANWKVEFLQNLIDKLRLLL